MTYFGYTRSARVEHDIPEGKSYFAPLAFVYANKTLTKHLIKANQSFCRHKQIFQFRSKCFLTVFIALKNTVLIKTSNLFYMQVRSKNKTFYSSDSQKWTWKTERSVRRSLDTVEWHGCRDATKNKQARIKIISKVSQKHCACAALCHSRRVFLGLSHLLA